MHLLYLDDSGSVRNAADRHIILAGIEVFERLPHWLSRAIDEIAQPYWPDDYQNVEFRGVNIFAGRKQWRLIPREERKVVYKRVLALIAAYHQCRLFGAAIHKASVSPNDAIEVAFEQMANRFDRFLGRLHRDGDTQRGVIILDKGSYETSLQSLAREFRTVGHSWGRLRNLAEVPMFIDSRASRMVQLADIIAYALRRLYEKNDPQYFNIIRDRFDAEGGVIHGLVHWIQAGSGCDCPPCVQRVGY